MFCPGIRSALRRIGMAVLFLLILTYPSEVRPQSSPQNLRPVYHVAGYTVINLSSLDPKHNVRFCEGAGINNRFQVTGYLIRDYPNSSVDHFDPSKGLRRAFLWEKGAGDLGTLRELGALAPDQFPNGGQSEPVAINNRGEIVGASNRHAFLYRDGQMLDLNPPGAARSAATAINDTGQIVGVYEIHRGRPHPDKEGPYFIANVAYQLAYRPNRFTPSLVCFTDGEWHGFLYQGGKWTDLGRECYPAAINNRGEIAGQIPPRAASGAHAHYFHRENQRHTAVYREGKWTLLDVPFGDPKMETRASYINDAGDVLGTYSYEIPSDGQPYHTPSLVDAGFYYHQGVVRATNEEYKKGKAMLHGPDGMTDAEVDAVYRSFHLIAEERLYKAVPELNKALGGNYISPYLRGWLDAFFNERGGAVSTNSPFVLIPDTP